MKFRCMFSFAGFCTTGQRIVIGQRTVFYRPPIQEMFSKKTGSNSAKEQQLLSIHASFSVHFVPAIVSDAKCYFFSLQWMLELSDYRKLNSLLAFNIVLVIHNQSELIYGLVNSVKYKHIQSPSTLSVKNLCVEEKHHKALHFYGFTFSLECKAI